jgi:hypothetical protein
MHMKIPPQDAPSAEKRAHPTHFSSLTWFASPEPRPSNDHTPRGSHHDGLHQHREPNTGRETTIEACFPIVCETNVELGGGDTSCTTLGCQEQPLLSPKNLPTCERKSCSLEPNNTTGLTSIIATSHPPRLLFAFDNQINQQYPQNCFVGIVFYHLFAF